MHRPPFVRFKIPGTGKPITQAELIVAIERELTEGTLLSGMRLPPVRALQKQLGISKNTVQAAYDELCARGALQSRPRDGVYVAQSHALPSVPEAIARRAATLGTREFAMSLPSASASDTTQLGNVFVDPALLPQQQLTECYRSVLRSPGLPSQYSAQGHQGLRRWIAKRLTERGMATSDGEVILTTGSQQALEVIARALRTGPVATESPVYGYAKSLFQSSRHPVFGLPLCPFRGADMAQWSDLIARHRPKLVYVITSYQNPTGYSYSTQELLRLLELSEQYQFCLVEDDWGSDMQSGSDYRPTLRALGGSNVLYVNSFTKKLFPSLRLGYLVANSQAIPDLVAAKRLSCLGSAPLNELALSEFVDRGYYNTHLVRLHEQVDVRYQECVTWLREQMPSDASFSLPGGGPSLWFEPPPNTDRATLHQYCQSHGVELHNADTFFYGERHLHGFRIGYAALPQAQLREALSVLRDGLTAQGFTR